MLSRKLAALALLFFLSGATARCLVQDSSAQDTTQQPSTQQGQRPSRRGQWDTSGQFVGRITAIKNSSLDLSKDDGTTVTVKLNEKTEFRKDRQPAKMGDFKVGDMVFVRGDQNHDQTVSASLVAGRSVNSLAGGPGSGRGSGGAALGELGKDYVAGEVKSVDAPKLTVLRPDNVTQTIELNEETSLRKGRDSVTMVEIQPGDHVIARGTLQNNVFTPKNVMILSPEQWQRIQEMGARRRGPAESAPDNSRSNAPPATPPQQ
jgi:hypothetical protein